MLNTCILARGAGNTHSVKSNNCIALVSHEPVTSLYSSLALTCPATNNYLIMSVPQNEHSIFFNVYY